MYRSNTNLFKELDKSLKSEMTGSNLYQTRYLQLLTYSLLIFNMFLSGKKNMFNDMSTIIPKEIIHEIKRFTKTEKYRFTRNDPYSLARFSENKEFYGK